MCPRPNTHLTYMINIALTAEFTFLPIAAAASVRGPRSGPQLYRVTHDS